MFSSIHWLLFLLHVTSPIAAKIIPTTTASTSAVKEYHPLTRLKLVSHAQVYHLGRGGSVDSPNDAANDPYDEDNNDIDEESPPQKKKLLKPESGWSLLSAFRMQEEALIEMAGETDNTENHEGKRSTTKAKQEKESIQQLYQQQTPKTDKSRRSTIVGGAGAVATQPSTDVEHNDSSVIDGDELPNDSLQPQKRSQFAFSPGTVATAASRLINEYVVNEPTENADYDSYEEYEYDDDFDIDLDDAQMKENDIEFDFQPKKETQQESVTQHVEIISLQPADIFDEELNKEESFRQSRREKLENLVEESQMKDIQSRVYSRQPQVKSQIQIDPPSAPTKTKEIKEKVDLTILRQGQSRPVPRVPPPIQSSTTPLLLTEKSKSPPSVSQSKALSSDTVEEPIEESAFVSSGYWSTIDKMTSFGLSSNYSSLRLSKKLRSVRKATARVTGLHGFVSGKKVRSAGSAMVQNKEGSVGNVLVAQEAESLNEEALGVIRRKIAAIEDAKERLGSRIETDEGLFKGVKSQRKVIVRADDIEANAKRVGVWRRAFRLGRRGRLVNNVALAVTEDEEMEILVRETQQNYIEEVKPAMSENEITISFQEEEIRRQKRAIEVAEDIKSKARVQEIDRLILEGQNQMVELQCEKDFLQRRPNPLFNYTSENSDNVTSSRVFNFPPSSLVDEYVEELKSSRRLIMLDHTSLWRGEIDGDDEDESIGDDLFTPSADAKKLYVKSNNGHRRKKNNNNVLGGGGSWLLRQTIGKGVTLGEKLGETVEVAAYQAVCSAVMSVLARSISAMHGTNVMEHSDIRLYLDQAPDLPPVGKNLEASTYAEDKIKQAIQRGSKRNRGKSKNSKQYRSAVSDTAFIQRDAVAETLISHCQISAPLLKLFPLNWQRAMLANIITLITAITSDFCAGMKFQILGHELSLSFQPITEKDVIRHIGERSFNNRRSKPEEFEYAVSVTAQDLSDKMTFLDRWHHRVLGSGMLRAQIGNLIARIVLTLVDDVLRGATMDLWSAQAGGPRVIAGLEYRIDKEISKK